MFATKDAGFDAVVGNPPFLGGSKISTAFGDEYRRYLFEQIADKARGKADLVAYFVLASYRRLRAGGSGGMIVTTSIAEGDSRAICLDQLIDAEDAVIVRVVPTMLWPGAATVTVGCLWLHKGSWSKPSFIDDRPVGRIGTDFRNESKQLSQFARLVLNTNRCWRGTEINGPGFVLTAEEAKELIRLNPKNGEILCKNLTGSDVNTSPTIEIRPMGNQFSGLVKG